MRSSRVAAAAALALAIAGAQSATNPALLAFTVGLLAHDHGHSASIVSEQGHLHIVLSHADADDHDHSGAPHHDDRVDFSGSDHIFDLTKSDPASFAARRATIVPIAALSVPAVMPPISTERSYVRPPPEPRSRGADLLKLTVLRL